MESTKQEITYFEKIKEIEEVLSEISNKTYFIRSNVVGEEKISLSGPIPKTELLKRLEDLLNKASEINKNIVV